MQYRTGQYCTTQHSTTQHSAVWQSTSQYSMAQHEKACNRISNFCVLWDHFIHDGIAIQHGKYAEMRYYLLSVFCRETHLNSKCTQRIKESSLQCQSEIDHSPLIRVFRRLFRTNRSTFLHITDCMMKRVLTIEFASACAAKWIIG